MTAARRQVLWAVLLGGMAHVALLGALLRSGRWTMPVAERRSTVSMRWVEIVPATADEARVSGAGSGPSGTTAESLSAQTATATLTAKPTPTSALTPVPRARRIGAPMRPRVDDRSLPDPTRPAAPTSTSTSTSTFAGTPTAPTASAPSRALDLALPWRDPTRPTARSPVLDDPRANTPRLTAEQRMARTFDTRVIEESLGDGRVRIRRGDSCVIVSPSRQSELFAGNGSGGPAPRLVSNCP